MVDKTKDEGVLGQFGREYPVEPKILVKVSYRMKEVVYYIWRPPVCDREVFVFRKSLIPLNFTGIEEGVRREVLHLNLRKNVYPTWSTEWRLSYFTGSTIYRNLWSRIFLTPKDERERGREPTTRDPFHSTVRSPCEFEWVLLQNTTPWRQRKADGSLTR